MPDELDFNMNFEAAEQNDADKKLLVAFFKDTIKNETKSIEAGRPIFDEIDLIKIITPGSRDSFVGDATPEYQQRFLQQWTRYKAGRDQEIGNGTPLQMLPWITVSQLAEFRAVGVYTVEHLVGMADAISQKFMGHHQLKQRAQAYLDAAKESAPTVRLQAELEKRDEKIAAMDEINKQLEARLVALEKPEANKVAAKG